VEQLSDVQSKSGEETKEKIIKWRSHPLTENIPKTAAFIAVLALVLSVVYFAFNSLHFVALAAVVLFLSLMRYFVPTHYQADSRGISILFFGISKFREWSSFRNVYVHPTGVHLAPFERPSALDSFRGTFLLFGRGDKNEIVEFVRKNIQRAEEKENLADIRDKIDA
jgi:hypothetical protein